MVSVPPVAALVFGSALVGVIVGIVALRERPDPMAWPVSILMLAVAAWTIPHGISLLSTERAYVVFWQQLQYPGIMLAPTAYFLVALRYAGYDRWLSKRLYAGLAIVPALTIVVVWTNPLHGLFWREVSIQSVGNATVFTPEYGPWYWGNLAYLYILTGVGIGLFALKVIRAGPLHQRQSILMFTGGIIPLLTNVIWHAAGEGRPLIDYTTTALTVTGVTFALALFRLDLMDLRPVARDKLLEEFADGVVVTGPEGRIVDFNAAADRLFDGLEAGQPGEDVIPLSTATDGGELITNIGHEERVVRVRSSTITDDYGRESGCIVYLNDITELMRREQRIDVLNRILRHNIRNQLNVALGRLELLGEQIPEEEEPHLDQATSSIERVVELSNKARGIHETLEDDPAGTPVSIRETVERVIAEAKDRFNNAEVTSEFNCNSERPLDDVAVVIANEDLFELALMELVENGIKHNNSDTPRVTVRLDRAADVVRIQVIDNGPGIPEAEQTVLSSQSETQLEHGSGLGLWLVRWTASISAGEFQIDSDGSRGSTVTLSIPIAED